jgi:glycosyltransferase involved in cell wall biosynthesis
VRICLISQEYPPETAHGGIGSQNSVKARMLTRLGHEVHVLSCSGRDQSELLRTEEHDGVMVHRMRPPGSDWPVYNQPTYWIGYSWQVLHHLHALHAQSKFDLFDFAEYGAEGFAYLLDRTPWNFVPTVVQLHGPLAMFTDRIGWPDRGSDLHQVGSFMEGVCIRKADALMACSANIADYTAQRYDLQRSRIDVVHCGVDTELFVPGGQVSPRPLVLFVGNIAGNKGVFTVFDAVLKLRKAFPTIRLQVLGKGDEEIVAQFRQQAAKAGAADLLDLVGFVKDRSRMPEFYRSAHVFCSPAHHEVGVANVYIEAMACGCPVVAANTGGAPEAVIDGKTGFLVPPDDSQAVAAAIERVIGDPQARARLGSAGRLRAEEYFAMDHYTRRVLATYEKAIRRAQEQIAALERQDR